MENEPRRILHIIRTMNVGGAETFIMNVYRNIDRNKIQFDFLVNGKGFFDEEIRSLGGKLHYISYLTQSGQFSYKKCLKHFFVNHPEYEIIHSHIDQVSGIILEAAKECNVPVRVSHSHNVNNSNNFIAKIYKKYLQSKINQNATHYFACSIKAGEWLFKTKAKEMKIINNGIEIEKFKYSQEKRIKIRKELGIPSDCIVIGNIGSLRKQKNHEFLIDIFNEYLSINNNAILLIVGTGSLEKRIKSKISNLGIDDKVKLLGIREDTDYLYSAFDCFVFPSFYEGLGITLIEAQASGLKTIASADAIPIETKITNLIQYVSLKESAKEWANKISFNIQDRENVNKTLIDSEYNIKKVVTQLQKFYEEVI